MSLIKTLENNAVDLTVYANGIETNIESFKNYEPENLNIPQDEMGLTIEKVRR